MSKVEVYKLLHEFRNWNKEWDLYFSKNPKNLDEFVKDINKKYKVKKRKI